jgi:hypothetical protein
MKSLVVIVVEVGGRMVEVGGRMVEVGGRMVEVGGRMVEVGGRMVEVGVGRETLRRTASFVSVFTGFAGLGALISSALDPLQDVTNRPGGAKRKTLENSSLEPSCGLETALTSVRLAKPFPLRGMASSSNASSRLECASKSRPDRTKHRQTGNA